MGEVIDIGERMRRSVIGTSPSGRPVIRARPPAVARSAQGAALGALGRDIDIPLPDFESDGTFLAPAFSPPASQVPAVARPVVPAIPSTVRPRLPQAETAAPPAELAAPLGPRARISAAFRILATGRP